MFNRSSPVAKLKELKTLLEGPGAQEYQDAIDEIVASLEKGCPYLGAIMDFAHAPAEAGEGPTDRLLELAEVDDGSRPSDRQPCPDGKEGCMVFHGTPTIIGFEEALRTRPRMYRHFIPTLIAGMVLRVGTPEAPVVDDSFVPGRVTLRLEGDLIKHVTVETDTTSYVDVAPDEEKN